ncbi:MAG: hypothetical protein V2G42_08995 [bacterium JZ-2024 1]
MSPNGNCVSLVASKGRFRDPDAHQQCLRDAAREILFPPIRRRANFTGPLNAGTALCGMDFLISRYTSTIATG